MKSSKLNYFAGCTTLEEVKALYKTLAKANHPDLGGSTEAMQAINSEYSIACKLIANGAGMTSEEFEKTIVDTEAYKEALEKIIILEGIIIECVGSWVWVTGNTYEHRNALKDAKFQFANKKKAWYFRTEEFKVSNRNKNMSLDDIKNKYGSTLISGKSQNNLLNK